MAIYVTGDTHGADSFGGYRDVNGYIPRLNMRNFPEQKSLTKKDIVIICGDFGGVWNANQYAFEESSKEKHDLDWLDSRSFTTFFVPGNHENYDRLTGCKDERLLSCWYYEDMPEMEKEKLRKGYPRKDWHGGTVRMIRPSVLMAEPGVFDLCGHKCFCYGGAESHDIQDGILDPADFSEGELYYDKDRLLWESGALYRVKGVSWWAQEQPGPEQEEQALQALHNAGDHVDFIFTHDAPEVYSRQFSLEGPTRINRFLQIIKDTVSYRHWYFGHYHDNVNLPGAKDHLIYEKLIQLA